MSKSLIQSFWTIIDGPFKGFYFLYFLGKAINAFSIFLTSTAELVVLKPNKTTCRSYFLWASKIEDIIIKITNKIKFLVFIDFKSTLSNFTKIL
jgi:hypothetical protein